MSDDRRPPRIVERDRRRFTPDGRPRAAPGETKPDKTKPGEPRRGEPDPGAPKSGEPASPEARRAEAASARPEPPEPPEPPAGGRASAGKAPSAASPPTAGAAGDAEREAPGAETADPAPPLSRPGNEGRERLVGFLLSLADTYLRVIAARAAEPAGAADGGSRKARTGQDPAAQALAGLEQVLSFFLLLTEPAAPAAAPSDETAGETADETADAPVSGAPPGDPRLPQLVQLLLAQADYTLRAAAAPAAAGPEGEPGAEGGAALRGAEALAGFQEVIGMLEALEQHTRPRQTGEESRMMSRALYRLRMDYLALAGAPAGAPATR